MVPFTPVRKYLTGYGDVFDSLVFSVILWFLRNGTKGRARKGGRERSFVHTDSRFWGRKKKKKSFVTEERFGKHKERNEKEQRENLSHHRPRETRQRPPLIILRDKTKSWFGKAQWTTTKKNSKINNIEPRWPWEQSDDVDEGRMKEGGACQTYKSWFVHLDLSSPESSPTPPIDIRRTTMRALIHEG